MAGVKVVKPGLLSTVQDCGRWGFQAWGVPVAGAMDSYSHRLANLLVGNDASAATLEVTISGPVLEFETNTVVAVSGAAFELTSDDGPVSMHQKTSVRAGAVLRFGKRIRGARAYVAVAGGIDVRPFLGSRSTHMLTAMGGHQGRALRAGDRLPIGEVTKPSTRGRVSSPSLPDGGASVRVLPGDAAEIVTGNRFVISPESNRMGYRLEGPTLPTMSAAEKISGPVVTGAIQVPPSGRPMLLMNDHATAGGYVVAATVISADLPIAAQLAPGDWIEFRPCTMEEADSAMRALEESLAGAAA